MLHTVCCGRSTFDATTIWDPGQHNRLLSPARRWETERWFQHKRRNGLSGSYICQWKR
ncbi:unnamed protein product [Mycena citricolor]|uniref:Uncharacterized protein n=1 Tax=Mycena citricolor TaxID=2018698 RepID=A0AAD2HS96_9AGAR|nr:unnamed protein product [Mycena citricolor]CAK5281226.1 unnamed protein product [Mycena citricolor]